MDSFWTLADACWPAHEVTLDVVRPALIVAYGNGQESAYEYLRHRFQQNVPERDESSGWGRTKLKAFNYSAPWGRVLVIGLPFPSRHGLLAGITEEVAIKSSGESWPVLRPQVAEFVRR